jgi:membrane protein
MPMSDPNVPDPLEPAPLELEAQPTVAGRLARWTERARILRGRVDDARERHRSVDLGFDLVERDSTVGGGLLAGALAYRLFVVLLPSALLLVSGLGLYAGAVDRSPTEVAREAGLTGLVASQVASAASSGTRWLIFLAMVPTVLYAIVKLYRSIAIVFAIVWDGSGRGVRISRNGVVLFIAAMALHFAAVELVGWIRRSDQHVGVATLLVYLGFVGGAWLIVSTQLPHRDVRWPALIPGAALFGAGLLCVNVFNVYVTTRLVEGRADTYGALGVATALLFSLVLVGRLMVASAVLNATLYERRTRSLGGT